MSKYNTHFIFGIALIGALGGNEPLYPEVTI